MLKQVQHDGICWKVVKMNDMTPIRLTTPKDWETDQEVRWCPGCGDYAIL